MTLHKQRGVVLVTCMIILFVITILALYMFGGFTQDEKISGNTREKARAVDASFSALNQAQFWMAQSGNVYDNGWKTGAECSASSTTPATISTQPANRARPTGSRSRIMPSRATSIIDISRMGATTLNGAPRCMAQSTRI